MAKYMVVYHLSPDARNEAIARFVEGSAMEAPDGISLIGRWHSAASEMGWAAVQTDDPKTITDWLLHWSDIMSYEAYPVISDEEFGELMVKHGFA